MIQAMLTSAEFCHALAALLFQTALALMGILLMGLIFIGAKKAFKNWRLYSRHKLAKCIRTHLRKRRQAKAARA